MFYVIGASIVAALSSAACSRATSAADVALEYGRAVYAYDAAHTYHVA